MKKIYYLIFLLMSFSSCEDYLDLEPTDKVSGSTVVQNLQDFEYALNGAYAILNDNEYYQGKFMYTGDMMAEDFYSDENGGGKLEDIYSYRRSTSTLEADFFQTVYLGINHINSALEKGEKLSLKEEKKGDYDALVAEFKCIRALMHFDISKMYGPIYTTLGHGDIKEDAKSIYILKKTLEDPHNVNYRNTTKEVYDFIVTELATNAPLLSKEIKNGYLNYWGAKALLARVYLYMAEYEKAYDIAKEIIEDSEYELIDMDDYVDSWAKDFTKESIFELSVLPNKPGSINSIGYLCLSDGITGYRSVAASEHFLDLKDDNPNDVRFELLEKGYDNEGNFDGWYPMGKYPGRSGDVFLNNPKLVRLSEIYLIAAETALYIEPSQAGYYLTELRKRRTNDEAEKYLASCTIDDVLFERRLELFCEGHRVFDMRRNLKTIVRYEDDIDELGDSPDDESSGGEIDFDWYKNIYPLTDREIEFLPFVDRLDEQNPGY
jgi:hypothetical protein